MKKQQLFMLLSAMFVTAAIKSVVIDKVLVENDTTGPIAIASYYEKSGDNPQQVSDPLIIKKGETYLKRPAPKAGYKRYMYYSLNVANLTPDLFANNPVRQNDDKVNIETEKNIVIRKTKKGTLVGMPKR